MDLDRTLLPIDPTPACVLAIHEKLRKNLEIVRAKARRPLGVAEKILLGHLDDAERFEEGTANGFLSLRPDRVVFQDVLGQTGMLQLLQTGVARAAVPTTIHCDHLIQARTDGLSDLRASCAENDEVYGFLRAAAARFGIGFWAPGAGIVHQVVLETYAFPGQLVVGTDSHTPNAGGLACCAVGVGGAEAVEVCAGLPWELATPKRIGVRLVGALRGWTAPKDVILHLAGRLGVSGATNAVIEYFGPGVATISATGRATITNMGAELGATTSIFPADERTLRYLRATQRAAIAEVVEQNIDLFVADAEVHETPEKYFDFVLQVDLDRLEPHVVGPHSPDRARPLSQLAAEVGDATQGFVDEVSVALVGSCTNSSYEDLTRAAEVAADAAMHGVRSKATLFVTPGSDRIRATTERDGQLAKLRDVGAVVLANACGPCIGQWRRADAKSPSTVVTSYNRNFAGRNDGNARTMAFIASPEIVTAFALAGRLSFDPRRDALVDADGNAFLLAAPSPAPDVPPRGFERGDAHYVPPPDVLGPDPQIDARSERLQRLEPWPAWDGRDLVDLPVLVKTKGKTTTDQISPAGAWLRLRGHLDRFSDNLLSGAVNAFDGATGITRNVFTRENKRISQVAREYASRGVRWVIVGDANYGEGSSREHAALSPRWLGCAAVIARSFARIHESNLKKQGILALTFDDAGDWERVRAGDRVSLIELQSLAPGRPVECVLHHDDGTTETLRTKHGYSASQLEWFRAGSALRCVSTEKQG